MQELPQQHHHHHYYHHPSQIPPSILQMHAHPTTFDHQPTPTNLNNTNSSSQIPVIAAAAQAILEQNNAAAAAFAANAFYRYQQQQQQQPSFHQTSSMVRFISSSFFLYCLSFRLFRSHLNNHQCCLDLVKQFDFFVPFIRMSTL